jgi:beta-lactamase class A
MPRPRFLTAFAGIAASFAALTSPAAAKQDELQATFDSTFGTQPRSPQSFEAVYASSFEQRIADLANPALGRIGVAAVDLATGEEVMVLGDQLFPMASTSKIAVAGAFLEMVEKGRYSLTSEFPLMMPVASAKYSSAKAPVRPGQYMAAIDLIEIMITRSSNPATDALLAAVGGPAVVNDWIKRKGIAPFSINRDIATLVRDDGQYNPANHIDPRDAATPRARPLSRGVAPWARSAGGLRLAGCGDVRRPFRRTRSSDLLGAARGGRAQRRSSGAASPRVRLAAIPDSANIPPRETHIPNAAGR